MAFYTNSSLIGVDFNSVSATQLFALGTIAKGSSGTEWVYCRAATAVTAYKAVVINGTFTCAMPSVSDSLGTVTAGRLGWAQTAFAVSDYGWIPVNGVVYGMATGSVTLTVSSSPLAVGASAVSTGMLVQSSASATVQGITPYAFGSGGQTATATAMQFILSWPRFGTPHF